MNVNDDQVNSNSNFDWKMLRNKLTEGDFNPEDLFMNTVYYFEKCGLSLDRNKLSQLRQEEPYNSDFHDHLESTINFAEEIDMITGNHKNILNRVYCCENHELSNFQINNQYLFFYNQRNINYFDFHKDFYDKNMKTIGLEIDEKEDDT